MVEQWLTANTLNKINGVLNKQYKLLNLSPDRQDVFNCLKYFNPEDTRIIILDNQPPGNDSADGLALSSKNFLNRNTLLFLKNLSQDGSDAKCGNLEYLAKQGVLLLNSSLTTLKSVNKKANIKWTLVINEILKSGLSNKSNVPVILLGGHARKYKKIITKYTNKVYCYPSLNGDFFIPFWKICPEIKWK